MQSTNGRKALLGVHDPGYARMTKAFMEMYGYDITAVETLEEMLSEMGLSMDSPAETEPANPFDLYFMDVNLGIWGGKTYGLGQRVYGHVQQAVENQEVKFIAVTAREGLADQATEAGVPCYDKVRDQLALLNELKPN